MFDRRKNVLGDDPASDIRLVDFLRQSHSRAATVAELLTDAGEDLPIEIMQRAGDLIAMEISEADEALDRWCGAQEKPQLVPVK